MHPNRSILLLLALLIAVTGISARPWQDGGDQYFEDTGFWVRGEFLDFYRSAPDPDRLFGSPISDSMTDPMRPEILVQYFERARFDYDLAKPEGQRVTLSPLGELLRDESNPGETLGYSTNSNMCRAFESDRLVCYAFLQYYEKYDGEEFFGQPISDTELLDGRLVQYFTNARMEWLPDRPAGERVILTELGRISYNIRVGPGGGNIPRERLDLNAQAFIARSVAAEGQSQRVFALIRDQRGEPVDGASVVFTIAYPDGRVENLRPEALTNTDGFTSADFTVTGVEPNQVVTITTTATLSNGPSASAATWFRVWW